MAPAARATPQARNRSGTSAPTWSCVPCGGVNPDGTRYCGHCGVPTTHATVVDEHRLITALFADISGFTTLADSLDTAALHRVISPVIGVLTGVAERYEGTIAKYAGDAVLVFFGAPVAVEDHADRALSCALDMHRALAEALPRLPEEAAHLKLHVGVNTGRVIAGMFGGDLRADYSILGDAVNVAQRLESVASPGETYVGELTHQLAAASFELEDLGGLTLKGKPEPVPAWRLVGDRRATRRATTRATALVGRNPELASLTRRVDALAAGAGGVATILADPGTGKSRLLEELQLHAGRSGCRWLEARSISYGATVPYWPFVDLLRRTFGIRLDLDPEDAAQRLHAAFADVAPRAANLVARLLGVPMPDGADAVDALSPEAFNRELSRALAEWIVRLAGETPTVLVFEDVHWLDSSSADLLRRIARLVSSDALLLVLSGRPEGEAQMAHVVAGSAAATRTDLCLGPLDRAAIDSLVAAVLAAPVAAETVTAIAERTGGNPFFTLELIRSLRDDEAFVVTEDGLRLREDAAAAVPLTVDGVISARIDRLPPPAAQVLLAASVVGRRVDLALLEGVTELDGHLPRMVDTLVEAGLLDRAVVDDVEVVRFHHALVVDVAYGRLVQRQRRNLHRRVAESAEVLYGSGDDVIDLLARHFYLADAGVKAVDYLERAATRAKRLYANDQAITHLRSAIELSRKTEKLTSRLPRLLLDVADLEQLITAYDDAARDYEEVRAVTGDVRAWCGLSAVHRKWGRYADADAFVARAFEVANFGPEQRAHLWLEHAATAAIEGRTERAIEAATAGLGLVGDTDVLVTAELLLRLARAEQVVKRLESALAHAQRARRIFESVRDERGLAHANRVIGDAHRESGQLAEAAQVLEHGVAIAERTGNAEELGGCLINLGLVYLALGRVDDAVACDERAMPLFEHAGNRNGIATTHSNLGEKLLVAGRVEQALEHCAAGLAIAETTGAVVICADAKRTIAWALLAAHDLDAAATTAREAAALFESVGDLVNAADALSVLEEVAAARVPHQPVAPATTEGAAR